MGFSSPLAERFAATAATGCQRATLSPPDVLRAAESGTSAADIARQAADLGLEPGHGSGHELVPRSRAVAVAVRGVSADDALRMCEALGVTSLTTIATASGDVPVAGLAAHFGRVCDRAAGFGAQVHLEFMPFTVVRDLRMAWDLVRTGRPNGGLVEHLALLRRADPDFDVLDLDTG